MDTNTTDDTWTEAQYEAALAQLETLANKITTLRTTIPSLISPLTRRQEPRQQQQQQQQQPSHSSSSSSSSPTRTTRINKPAPSTSATIAFTGLKKAAISAVSGVQDLRQEWQSQSVQEVLEKSKGSFARDEDLSLAGEVSEWGWVRDEVAEDLFFGEGGWLGGAGPARI